MKAKDALGQEDGFEKLEKPLMIFDGVIVRYENWFNPYLNLCNYYVFIFGAYFMRRNQVAYFHIFVICLLTYQDTQQ